ncbi:TIGR04076 family protein [Sutterella sp.]|uniref:TIGR04076 family protein n=1 Tax=Sutterella sp. TaxID=1981025 RepID=UPI0026DEB1E9|nr:TIGR04076 family protein [Sutterella sp.]MDO5532883.1 TIGR04076 family protein [Sutterella sp.]
MQKTRSIPIVPMSEAGREDAGGAGEKPVSAAPAAKTYRCRITVLKCTYNQELADQYLADPKVGPCSLFREGQSFVVDSTGFWKMLHGGFCSEAWDAISRYVYAALQGGSIMRGWTNDERMMITCCNDGVRPVIFRLERIED